jgi:glycosyltransferase involved in cell wall biosynthesis
MKILFLNTLDDPQDGGGAEVTLRHLTRGLAESGDQPVMLTTTRGKGLCRSVEDGMRIWRAGLKNIYWPAKDHRPGLPRRILWHAIDQWNTGMQAYLRHVLEVEEPDVVSLHNLAGWSAAVWDTLAQRNVPAVQVLHDFYNLCVKSTMYRRGRNCQAQCFLCSQLRRRSRGASGSLAGVIGVSSFVLRRHLERGFFSGVPVQRSIHNARDAAELGLTHPVSGSKREGPVRAGFIGRLAPSKGIRELLGAFGSVGVQGMELWIAGDGDPQYVASLKAEFQTGANKFLGRVSAKDFYPHIDFLVVPSLWQEPLGMVVAEAFAFGKPVIGSCRGGIPEMISDNVNGILYAPEEPDELIEAVRKVATDDEFRRRMARAAREAAEQFLDVEGWVANYRAVYADAIAVNSST